MIRHSANTGFLWPDLPFLERIIAAAAAGFDAVEFHDEAQRADPTALADALAEAGLPVIGLNAAMGASAGCAAIPGREAEAMRGAEEAIALAERVGAGAVHVLAGRTEAPDRAQYVRVLRHACAGTDRTILIEPICRAAMPDYALHDLYGAARLVAEVGAPNLRILFDRFHVETQHGGAEALVERHLPLVGHVQIASVPARADPDAPCLAFMAAARRAGYAGPFGCEWRAAGRPVPPEVPA